MIYFIIVILKVLLLFLTNVCSSRRVYWADLECGIEASRLDGSEQTILVPANVSTASSLSVDVLSGRIFWVDTELSLVWSMASNGTDLKVNTGSTLPIVAPDDNVKP